VTRTRTSSVEDVFPCGSDVLSLPAMHPARSKAQAIRSANRGYTSRAPGRAFALRGSTVGIRSHGSGAIVGAGGIRGIQRRRVAGRPLLHEGKHRREHEQRCQRCGHESSDDRLPEGRGLCPALPMAKARGSIPAVIDRLVIRMGRKRLPAPWTAASAAVAPAQRSRSAKVTSRIALAMATPMLMMAPIKDWTFNVEPDTYSANTTPAITAGVLVTVTKSQPPRLVVGRQQQEDHDHSQSQSEAQAAHDLPQRRDLATHS